MATALWIRLHRTLSAWLPRRLQRRLLLSRLALVALSMGSLTLWTGPRLHAATLAQAQYELYLQGVPLASLADAYAHSTGSRVTLVDANLRVLFSSEEFTADDSQEYAPELLARRDGREQPDILRDKGRGEERLFVAAPVRYQGQAIGFVQCSVPMAPIYAVMHRRWLSLLAVVGAVLGIIVLVCLVLARQIAEPVQRLTAAAEEIAAGHLERRVTPAGPGEIRRLGQAFNRMAERVQETVACQQAFMADAAHELRSPLTSILLRLELLQTHVGSDTTLMRRYLSQMEREVEQLRRMVDHLLTLCSLEAGQHPLQTALDLAPLLYDLADEIAPLIREAGLDLRVDVPAHLPPLVAQAEQLRIMVRNLLDNAIKHTPAGGSIVLSAVADNDTIQITVADSGTGIPAEALPHLFERFYRVDKARSRWQGGAGLGLALVHAVVQAHGGDVMVSSQPGRGSTFMVRLPTRRAGS